MKLSQEFVSCNWKVKYETVNPGNSHSNRTLIFVHGTPWSSVTFEPLAKALLALGGYRVLLYDLPGYGQSQDSSNDPAREGDNDTSIKTQALVLSELLEHIGLKPSTDVGDDSAAPDVIAHDIAGSIALRSILYHGCRFRSLLLMDTNCVLPWGDGFYTLARAHADVFRALPPDIFEAMLRAVIRSACLDSRKLNGGWEDALAAPWLASIGAEDADRRQSSFVRQIAQADDADVADMQHLYGRIACPTRILWGEKDRWIPRAKMERLAGMLERCLRGFVVVPDAGHLIMVDQPERVTAEVLSWLGSC